MVDVGEVVDPPRVPRPRSPLIPWMAALTFVIGFVGLTLAMPVSRLAISDPSPMVINGQVVSDQPVPIDFTKPFSISGLGSGSEARVELSLFGLPLGATQGLIEDGELVAHLTYLRWTTAGVVDLTVTVDDGAQVRTVGVAPTHPWYLTGPTAGALFVGLSAIALVGSNLRGLRRGELRPWSLLGVGFAGALLGLSIFVLVMWWQVTAPTEGVVALAIGSAAIASLAYGEGLRRLRKRQRQERRLRWLRSGTTQLR